MPKIFIVYYSMYGHIAKLAEFLKEGAEKVPGVEVEIYQVAETLPEEVLGKMHAPPKKDYPVIDSAKLTEADGILFGLPTRYGMMAAQMKAFFDTTGRLWQSGALAGKPAGTFVSTGTQNGGQETTHLTAITQFVHHGMIYVPLGYANPAAFNMDEVHGCSPYGTSTHAGPDGSRQPTELEQGIAHTQGENFAKVVVALAKGRAA